MTIHFAECASVKFPFHLLCYANCFFREIFVATIRVVLRSISPNPATINSVICLSFFIYTSTYQDIIYLYPVTLHIVSIYLNFFEVGNKVILLILWKVFVFQIAHKSFFSRPIFDWATQSLWWDCCCSWIWRNIRNCRSIQKNCHPSYWIARPKIHSIPTAWCCFNGLWLGPTSHKCG